MQKKVYTDAVYEIFSTENLDSLLARSVWAK